MHIAPLILTLKINHEAQELFNYLRKKHFPAEKNYLDAHLTLFHHLPANEPAIMDDIRSVCRTNKPLAIQVSHVASIGNGVAYKCESVALQRLHKSLQNKWEQWLIPQDTQTLWPHITVQNKVSPNAAKQLLQQLSVVFEPFEIYGTGLNLWEYNDGPWKFVESFVLEQIHVV